MHRGAMFQGLRGLEQIKRTVDSSCSVNKPSNFSQNHPSGEFRGVDTGDIQRGALPCNGLFHGFAMHLNAANADPLARRMQLHFLIHPDAARDQGTGDHRAESTHGESAVNGKTEILRGVFFGHRRRHFCELVAQLRPSLRR